jgi:hypothetical protein
MIQAR